MTQSTDTRIEALKADLGSVRNNVGGLVATCERAIALANTLASELSAIHAHLERVEYCSKCGGSGEEFGPDGMGYPCSACHGCGNVRGGRQYASVRARYDEALLKVMELQGELSDCQSEARNEERAHATSKQVAFGRIDEIERELSASQAALEKERKRADDFRTMASEYQDAQAEFRDEQERLQGELSSERARREGLERACAMADALIDEYECWGGAGSAQGKMSQRYAEFRKLAGLDAPPPPTAAVVASSATGEGAKCDEHSHAATGWRRELSHYLSVWTCECGQVHYFIKGDDNHTLDFEDARWLGSALLEAGKEEPSEPVAEVSDETLLAIISANSEHGPISVDDAMRIARAAALHGRASLAAENERLRAELAERDKRIAEIAAYRKAALTGAAGHALGTEEPPWPFSSPTAEPDTTPANAAAGASDAAGRDGSGNGSG